MQDQGTVLVPLYARDGTIFDYSIIDSIDSTRVLFYRWHKFVRKSKAYSTIYAATNIASHKVFLHRFIIEPSAHVKVDHKNHNGLDNRRANLRLSDSSQNNANSRLRFNNTSGFKGVSWRKRDNSWRVVVLWRNKPIHVGQFKDIIEAALAYDAKARELHGEFAVLNFPDL